MEKGLRVTSVRALFYALDTLTWSHVQEGLRSVADMGWTWRGILAPCPTESCLLVPCVG